jgi:capsular exopolysaccharide synthesis family protein
VQRSADSLDLGQVLAVLRRRLPLVVVCVVIVAGAAYAFSKRETKKYTASASLSFNSNPLSEQIAGLSTGGSTSSNGLLAQEANNVELVKSGETAVRTASLIDHGLTPARVIESVSVSGQGESSVVVVSATTTSPLLSAKIANTYVRQFVQDQQRANLRYLKSALAIVRRQLAALSAQQRVGPDGLELQNRAQSLSLLSELKVGNVQIGAQALVPSSPSSPKTSRNVALGFIVGLLIGVGLALALERFDRRIRSAEELESIYRLPLLGAVPQSAAIGGVGGRSALPAAVAEQFGLIRARLRFFNVDRQLRTVMIASAEPGEGKTVIARRLAEAAARAGSRVLLLEADLRQPRLAQLLDIEDGPGLADVLIGATPIEQAIRTSPVESVAAERGARTLDVLIAGAVLPPNPGELLESRAIDGVLEWAKSTYDLVVLDTPPLTVVSDAFPLLTKVDGVVVVSRVGRSRRHAAERLHQGLLSSGVTLLGIIANGSKSDAPSVYAYQSRNGGGYRPPEAIDVSAIASEEVVSPSTRA